MKRWISPASGVSGGSIQVKPAPLASDSLMTLLNRCVSSIRSSRSAFPSAVTPGRFATRPRSRPLSRGVRMMIQLKTGTDPGPEPQLDSARRGSGSCVIKPRWCKVPRLHSPAAGRNGKMVTDSRVDEERTPGRFSAGLFPGDPGWWTRASHIDAVGSCRTIGSGSCTDPLLSSRKCWYSSSTTRASCEVRGKRWF